MKKSIIAMALAAALPGFAQDGTGTTAAGNYWGPVNFESYSTIPFLGLSGAKDDGTEASGIESRWLSSSEDDQSMVTNYADGVTFAQRPDYPNQSENNNNYLKLSTDGATLWRYLNPVAVTTTYGDDGATVTGVSTNGGDAVSSEKDIYIDQMVQFTVSEEVGENGPNIDADAKLAIWLEKKEVVGDDGTVTATHTNLMVKGAYLSWSESDENFVTETKIYELTGVSIEAGNWYRLTVKARPNIFEPNLSLYLGGFEVYVDNQQMTATTDVAAEAATSTLASDEWSEYVKSGVVEALTFKKLILSMVGYGAADHADNYTAVGYQGTGAIDDLVITDVTPAFLTPPPAETFDVTFSGDNVASVKYTLQSNPAVTNAVSANDFSTAIAVNNGDTLIVTEATAVQGYVITTQFPIEVTKDSQNKEVAIAASAEQTGSTTPNYDALNDTQKAAFGGADTGKVETWLSKEGVTVNAQTDATLLNQSYLLNTDALLTAAPTFKVTDVTVADGKITAKVKLQVSDGDSAVSVDLSAINGLISIDVGDELGQMTAVEAGSTGSENFTSTVDETDKTVATIELKVNKKFVKVSIK